MPDLTEKPAKSQPGRFAVFFQHLQAELFGRLQLSRWATSFGIHVLGANTVGI